MSTSSHDIKLDGDGIVLYSSEAESLYRLNGTAAYIWSLLQSQSEAFNTEQIHAALQVEAKRLKLEGADSFRLSETKALMQRLVQLGLVRGTYRFESKEGYAVANLEPNESTVATIHLEQKAGKSVKVELRTFLWVLILFAAIDIYLKLAGFNSLLTRVQNYPTKLGRSRSDIEAEIGALDHAQVYYPKKQMCLQRSVALTLLLRDKGHPAQMVVGAQPYPAKAHAWVELDNRVIGESVKIKNFYHELFRV